MSSFKYYYVYKTTNLIDGKIYVGKHVSLYENDLYFGSGLLLNRAIEKYGIVNFKKEIIEYCNCDNLEEREVFWISELQSMFPNGYNLTKGGPGGDTISNHPHYDEICKKHKKIASEKIKDLNYYEKFTGSRRGKKHTQESKDKISKARKGIIFTDEHKKNISIATKEMMKTTPRYNQKSINCYNLDGEFIKKYSSISEAAKELNQNKWEICNMCKGRKHKIKDYIFKYE